MKFKTKGISNRLGSEYYDYEAHWEVKKGTLDH
jgi:hypothetical protein